MRHAAPAAEDQFYRPLWSTRILLEVEDAVLRLHPDLSHEAVHRRTMQMDGAFADASVSGWEQVAAGLDLPDPDDRHVLAAAITGSAQAIVTSNLKDFPAETLAARAVDARHPDEFLLDQLDLSPSRTLDVLVRQAKDLVRPPIDLAGLLNRLERCGVPGFVEAVRRLAPEDL